MEKIPSKELGRRGEKIALKYLRKEGYDILNHNFRFKHGEIDIVAFDKDYLCFVEVKTRQKDSPVDPLYSITEKKKKQLIKLAKKYIQQFEVHNQKMRFDVVIVEGNVCKESHVEIYKNAFREDR